MGRVEVDARGPQSQVHEALGERTKVDAEYNLPIWVLKTRLNIQGTFREALGNIQGTIREDVGNIQGTLMAH
jgi:hypothetical protein